MKYRTVEIDGDVDIVTDDEFGELIVTFWDNDHISFNKRKKIVEWILKELSKD